MAATTGTVRPRSTDRESADRKSTAGDPRYGALEHSPTIDLELSSILGAIGAGEVQPTYMPLVSLVTGRLVGVEALARWHHPGLGELLPVNFVPRLEQRGRVSDLTAWMVDTACADLARWQVRFPLPVEFRVAINVSATELIDRRLVQLVKEALARHDVPAGLLCLELTESARVFDLAYGASVLQELRQLGVRLAVDDFGAGFANQQYLDELPVDVVKIDQSFVAELLNQARCRDFVAQTVAHALANQLDVVAEGIETHEQARALWSMGCALGQGYAIGRAAPGDAILLAWLPGLAGVAV